jgi:hypothetical protein
MEVILGMYCRIIGSSSIKQLETDINDLIEREKKEVINIKLISQTKAPNLVALIIFR